MGSRVLPNNSALKSKEIWTAAIVQHERIWDDDERDIYDAVRARSTDAIRRACSFYRVSRTLSSDEAVQLELQEHIYGARITGDDRRRRLQSFAKHVEIIACDIGRLPPQNGRRPISAVSKLLVQLHPIDGFIYDRNARMTMNEIVGTPAKSDALEAYWTFVRSYSELFCELKLRIAEVLKDRSLPCNLRALSTSFCGSKAPRTRTKGLMSCSMAQKGYTKRSLRKLSAGAPGTRS